MTKSGLIEAVLAEMPHLNQSDAEIIVNTLFDEMTAALSRGDRIEIRGFGSFSVRQRPARTGRNPKTGKAIEVPEKRVPWFTVGNSLKERVNAAASSDDVAGGDASLNSASTDPALLDHLKS